MVAKRVVVAGLGDTGLLSAVRLTGHADVVGVSAKATWVSPRELGTRISRPDEWARDYLIAFDRFRALDRARIVHGLLTGVDLAGKRVIIRDGDGTTRTEDYDALVISTGVTNGFWRRPTLQSAEAIDEELRTTHDRFAAARSVIVVGGGPSAVSSAANLAAGWPGKHVGLYFPGPRPLRSHHPRVWDRIRGRLTDLGVGLHPGHRAVLPPEFPGDRIDGGTVRWSTGQPDAEADAVLWAVGRVSPNTGWLPAELLDENGFVRVTPELRVPGHHDVFAVGDVAATDPLRGSARNGGYTVLAHNVRAALTGGRMRTFTPSTRRWGSILGVQPDGMQMFLPNGYALRIPLWLDGRIIQPLLVRRILYHGVTTPRRRRRRAGERVNPGDGGQVPPIILDSDIPRSYYPVMVETSSCREVAATELTRRRISAAPHAVGPHRALAPSRAMQVVPAHDAAAHDSVSPLPSRSPGVARR